MPNTFNIGLSALIANQRALATIGNNIANANTPGYSRQRVELTSRPSERFGTNFLGTGVEVDSVRRLTDALLVAQANSAASSFERANTLSGLAARLDGLVADSDTGISAGLQRFFNSLQDVANDPASVPARQTLLSEAESLAARFRGFDKALSDLGAEVRSRVGAGVTEASNLAAQIAEVNSKLNSTQTNNGSVPSELLDQRDRLVGRLAELLDIKTVEQQDGSLNVFTGSGQPLVLGATSSRLEAVPGDSDLNQIEIDLVSDGGRLRVTSLLNGGEIGGLLDFRREFLEPAQDEIGRVAVGLANRINELQAEGFDLNGQFGSDLFAVGAPVALARSTNTGAATVSITIDDASALEATGYSFRFDGAAFTLTDDNTGLTVPLAGTGTPADPYRAAGIALVVAGAPAAGDEFQLEPVAFAASGVQVLTSDPAAIAAAAPVRTQAATTNSGSGTIGPGAVVDASDANLLTTSTVAFIDPNTYSINGAGAFAYVPGQDIVVNGFQFAIDGAPAAGDEFTLTANAGGIGDNRNVLRMFDSAGAGFFSGGSLSLQAASNQLIAKIGSQTQTAFSERDTRGVLLDQARASVAEVSGVNLDEEAADLLRYEQAYQAAAQTIAVADSLFQSLLAAVRR